MAELGHSTFSASGSHTWLACPGSIPLSALAGGERTSSEYAAQGTAAHLVLTWALNNKALALSYPNLTEMVDGYLIDIDEEMTSNVQITLDYVWGILASHPGAILLVDRRVNYAGWIGVGRDQGWGTLDIAIIIGNEIVTIDLKYGKGVRVEAGHNNGDVEDHITDEAPAPNPQLALYALGILTEVEDFAEIERVRLVISQPRVLEAPSEYDLSLSDLKAWAQHVAAPGAQASVQAGGKLAKVQDAVAQLEWEEEFLRPGPDQCRWCKAKATCPKLRAEVSGQVFEALPASPDEFESLNPADPAVILDTKKDDAPWLAACLGKVDLIEDWCKAVRAEVENRLASGHEVPGYKLVAGKRGNRQWTDPVAVEDLLKNRFRLKTEEMYDFKLISPTSAEKLAPKLDKKTGKPVPLKEGAPAPVIGPRQWAQLKDQIVQRDGKPHVAPVSDPRPPLLVTPVADGFESAPSTPSAEDFS